MRYRRAVLILFILCFSIAMPLFAEEGELKDKIIQALEANANGECDDEVLGPYLMDVCEQQLPMLQRRMQQLGDITGARFRGNDTAPNGVEVEVWRIQFEHGSMTWMAAAGANGKLTVLWSPG